MNVTGAAVLGAMMALAACRPAGQAPTTEATAGQEIAATEGANQFAPQVVDSQAVEILRRSMNYLNGLQRFSVKTEIVTEDLLDTGNRVDYVAWGSVIVERPNKLRGERHGVGFRQTLYFDGSTMTLADSVRNVYATKAAPGGIPDMFEMAYDSLGLSVPISDLVWPDVFPLLMKDVSLARVVGKEIIDGVICDHLVFSRPQVEFQIWIPDAWAAVAAQVHGERPLDLRPAQHGDDPQRLEGRSAGIAGPVRLHAAEGGAGGPLPESRNQSMTRQPSPNGGRQ